MPPTGGCDPCDLALELGARSRVHRAACVRALRRLAAEGSRFDLILLDPPYDFPELEELLRALVAAEVGERGATVVVETSKRHSVPAMAGLARIDERQYGDTAICIFRVEAVATGEGDTGGHERRHREAMRRNE